MRCCMGVHLFEERTGRRHFITSCTKILPFLVASRLEAKQLIHGLLQRDPSSRIGSNTGANDIKEHPFFEDIYWPLIRCMSPPELDVPLKLIGKESQPKVKPEEGVIDTF
ncbi:unnamed protein product [Triticum turgidum subsp. durum]|uniref:non-specific serine/threonine protein kinase n=1 Tax=Triticum turgidum subsp. durum TaxID=4567 RepID=A0A9R1NUF6_TRITD|nr:unnamed protein product [Triticum turgidum subsp. durum]